MAPAHSQPICSEWKYTLVGLQMSIPQYWWLDMLDQNLHQGFLHLFLEDTNLWPMKIDDVNEQEMYPIQWDAVADYTNVGASTFAGYCLPAVPVPPSANEVEIKGKKYVQTKPEEWTKVNNTNGRNINEIPFTGNNKDFSLNVTPTEIEAMKNLSGGICFHKGMEYLLPRFKGNEAGQQSLWEWQAA